MGRRKWLRGLAFLLLAAAAVYLISGALERKTLTGTWNYMGKMREFYAQPEDSLDYICLGSSHAYCTVDPLTVWHESGIAGFVLATQQQPLPATCYYLREALKTQSPQVVLLEAYMAFTDAADEAVYHDAIDPLHFSLNKVQMIRALIPAGERSAYYFDLIKYHTRWKEWTSGELEGVFHPATDIYKGFVCLNGSYRGENRIPAYDAVVPSALPEKNLAAMEEILALTRQAGAKLVLLIAPYDTGNGKVLSAMKAAREWAAQRGVPVLDYALLLEKVGVDPAADYYDSSHLDRSGAAKVSAHLAGYLREMGLEASRRVDAAAWQRDWEVRAGA